MSELRSKQYMVSFSEYTAAFLRLGTATGIRVRVKAYLHDNYIDERPRDIREQGLLADPQNLCGKRDHHSATYLTYPEEMTFMDFIVSLNPHGEELVVRRSKLTVSGCIARFLEGLAAGYYHNNQPPPTRKRPKLTRILVAGQNYYIHSNRNVSLTTKSRDPSTLTPSQLEDRLLYVIADLADLQEGENPTLERERDTINDLLARVREAQHHPNSGQ